jgi:hypothetical protein
LLLQLGLDRLGRERLVPDAAHVDPSFGLRPLGGVAFMGLWMFLAWLVPVLLTALPDVAGVVDGLLPGGRVWRTGANLATHFVAWRDVVIGGTTVPSGRYTLWTIPTDSTWQLILNRQTGQWGTVYDPAQDLARIPLQVRRVESPIEQLTFRIEQRPVGGELVIAWDTTEASVPFSPR